MNNNQVRDRLIRVSTEQLVRKGIKTVTVDSIVSEAGISKRTFYEYFDSKSALVEICLNHIRNEVEEKARRIVLETNREPLESLVSLVEEYIGMLKVSSDTLLRDLHHDYQYESLREESMGFWKSATVSLVERCGEAGFLTRDIDIINCADTLIECMQFMRKRRVSPIKQLQCARIFIRGMLSEKGLRYTEKEGLFHLSVPHRFPITFV